MDTDGHTPPRHRLRRIRRRFVSRGPYLDVDADVSITYGDGLPIRLPADDGAYADDGPYTDDGDGDVDEAGVTRQDDPV